MRKLNEINEYVSAQADYYENNRDYSDEYILMYNAAVEDEVEVTAETGYGYSYMPPDALEVYSVGEIEISIETDLTQKEYDAISDNLYCKSRFDARDGVITGWVCLDMNIIIKGVK